MSNIHEELIEYCGVSGYVPKDLLAYKEFNVDTVINLCENFNRYVVNEIVKVSIFPKVKSSRIVLTPKGKSLEGQVLSGNKFIIEGEINIRVDYITDGESNKIYCLYYTDEFSSSIILHKEIINKTLLIPSIFIEGINAKLLDANEILVVTTILTTVEK